MSQPEDKKLELGIKHIANKVDLNEKDLGQIRRFKKKQTIKYVSLTIFTYLIGFLGGWVFMSSKSDVSKIGYPISQVFVGTSLISGFQKDKTSKKFFLVLGFIILIISGFISGGILGTFFHPTFSIIPGSTTYYGVYSNPIYGS